MRLAGVKGEVSWNPDADMDLPAQVTVHVDARDSLLQACLRNGYANPAVVGAAKRDDTGSLTMSVKSASVPNIRGSGNPPGGDNTPERKEALLRYIIPAAVLAPPVVVAIYVRQHRPAAGEFANQNIFHVVLRVILHAALFPVD